MMGELFSWEILLQWIQFSKIVKLNFSKILKILKKSGMHYNVFIKNVQPNQSAGSIGEYKFCKEGKPPKKVYASIILNIKDNQGDKYYQRG